LKTICFTAFGLILVLTAAAPSRLMAKSKHPLVDQDAPLFQLPDQDGSLFNLSQRKNKGWTILFFYPKAATSGCTKQVCAFRDAIEGIRKLNAEVYGVSSDSVSDQKRFHSEQELRFSLLSDENGRVAKLYRNQRKGSIMAQRRTYIIDAQLRVRKILDDVDPAADPQNVIEALQKLQGSSKRD